MNQAPKRKNNFLRNLGILVGVFVLGMIPPYFRARQLQGQLDDATQQLAIAQTRELATLSYLEASRNNFGLAAQHATTMFDRLSSLQIKDSSRRAAVDAAAGKRNSVMSSLANADPAARNGLQEIIVALSGEGGEGTRARLP